VGRIVDARTQLAGLLEHALPDVDVVVDARSPEQLPRRRVVLLSRSVDPSPVACPVPVLELEAWAITPLTTPGRADDDVDDFVDDVLDALDDSDVVWTSCERGLWADAYPCFRITIERMLQ
jgi:hypothetical protein